MRYFWIPIFLLGFFVAKGQPSVRSISFSLLNHSFFYPSHHIFQAPLHLGANVDVEFDRHGENLVKKSWSTRMGFYHHAYFENGFFLNVNRNYVFPLGKSFEFVASPTLGYIHTASATQTFKWEDGQYVKSNGHQPNVNLGVSCQVSLTNQKFQPFIRMTSLAYGPFAIGWGVPVAAKTMTEIGFTYNLKP